MNCKQCKELMVVQLYNETDSNQRAEFQRHLESCPTCSKQYEAMVVTLDIISGRNVTLPDDSHFARQWEKIEQRITEEDSASNSNTKKIFVFPVHIPVWVYSAAAVLLIVVGIYLGKTSWQSSLQINRQPAPRLSSVSIVKDSVDAQVLAYLGTSKNLLLGVINTDAEDYSAATLEHQQRISRKLLQQATYIKTSLRSDQQQIKQLVGDLEIILVQLANIEVKRGVPAIELVKNGVDKKSILLKINVEEIRAMIATPETQKSKDHDL